MTCLLKIINSSNNKHSLCLFIYVDENTPWMACRLLRNIELFIITFAVVDIYHHYFLKSFLFTCVWMLVCMWRGFLVSKSLNNHLTVQHFHYLLSHFPYIAFCMPWMRNFITRSFFICCVKFSFSIFFFSWSF